MASLHLSIDENIKKKAQRIAQSRGINLSELTENFYLTLIRQEEGEEIASELLDRPKLQEPKNRKKAKDAYFRKKYGL